MIFNSLDLAVLLTTLRSAHDLRILHVGAGSRKVEGSIALDINPHCNPDVVWDLGRFPYPFRDSEFDVIVCEHVLEHLQHVIPVLEELHRVCKPGGLIWVRVPHFSSLNYNTDPTHTHAFSSRSLNYLCEGEQEIKYRYSQVRFRKLVARMTMRPSTAFNRLVMGLINRIMPFYEEHLAYIIPGQELLFILQAIKEGSERHDKSDVRDVTNPAYSLLPSRGYSRLPKAPHPW